MNRLEQLRKQKQEKIESLEAILQLATDEKRDISDDEIKKYDATEKEVDALNVNIAREEKLEKEKVEMRKVVNPINLSVVKVEKNADETDFRTINEFLEAVAFNPTDPRLEFQDMTQRAQSMGTGTKGGFMVPKQFLDTLYSVKPGEAIFRPRAQVLPAGSPPDSSITIPTLDQTAAQNVYGGMAMVWISEAGTKPETDINLREVELTPKELAGTVVATDKLLRNAAAFSGLLTGMMRKALIGAEETAFYSGNGVGKPLGILNSPARKNYTRATANQISYADVVGMFAIVKMGGPLVWIASQTIIPQLMNMTDPGSGGTVIWQQSAREGMPGTLFGIPLMFHERSVALGTTGDLILCSLDYYLIKPGSGPFVALSEHVYFTTNKTVFKIFTNVDGQPWLSAPLPLEGSTANTVSPFIVLD